MGLQALRQGQQRRDRQDRYPSNCRIFIKFFSRIFNQKQLFIYTFVNFQKDNILIFQMTENFFLDLRPEDLNKR